MVTVATKDGRKFRQESTYARMNEADLDAKFSALVGLRAGKAKAQELAGALKRLDTVSNVAEVMVRLELPEVHIEQVQQLGYGPGRRRPVHFSQVLAVNWR